MSEIALKIENVSKIYRLGQVGTGTLAHDLNRWWAQFRGKEDPYLKIGERNRQQVAGNSEYAWALNDINLEVMQGEVLGVIGKNGAGKSTLLKILARVTGPTTGKIKVKGRIGSLLEVGTGFHPELTGRENVFLNGAIMGMSRIEVRNKFDDIVSFAGVERYIDTPVKRYSSGMYVRLAFAVAAFLEPEILIVDEVLAVGDVEFQKRAIGKMQEVSNSEGRTVLFVSHNMAAVSDLCHRAVLLQEGTIKTTGLVKDVISAYVSDSEDINTRNEWSYEDAPGDENIKLKKMELINRKKQSIPFSYITEDVGVLLEYDLVKDVSSFALNLNLYNSTGTQIFSSHQTNRTAPIGKMKAGCYKSIVWIPGNLLQSGDYLVGIAALRYNPLNILFNEKNLIRIQLIDTRHDSSRPGDCNQIIPGIIRPRLEWETLN